jgi:hypothetical protein
MRKAGNFTPDEMNKALRLASELYEQDTEHKSTLAATEEMGVPPEYMARAMARIYAERQGKKSTVRVWMQAAVAVICFAAIYWSARSITQSVRNPAYANGPAAPPPDFSRMPTELSQLPLGFGPDAKVVTHGMNQQYPTTIQFHNASRETVQLYQLDSQGARHFTARLPNMGLITENTWFTHPWQITDTQSNSLGVVYPSCEPGQVDIRPFPAMVSSGYSLPLAAKDADPVVAASRGLSTAIEIVNVSGEPAALYRLAWDGTRERIGTLAKGEGIFEPTWENERWVAKNDEVDDTFKPDLNPTVAVIQSMDRYITNPRPVPQ